MTARLGGFQNFLKIHFGPIKVFGRVIKIGHVNEYADSLVFVFDD
jgi:hypothetical protein